MQATTLAPAHLAFLFRVRGVETAFGRGTLEYKLSEAILDGLKRGRGERIRFSSITLEASGCIAISSLVSAQCINKQIHAVTQQGGSRKIAEAYRTL